MRVLITGARGMLAHAVVPELRGRGHDLILTDREELDITGADAVRDFLRAQSPDAVVHCAAYTQVDAAEADEAGAMRINAEGTASVAAACAEIGAWFGYPSTDYVFPGTARTPYRPGDPTRPLNAYGRSKLAGEQAALASGVAAVVRTSWLYGQGGANFVDTITRLARERERLEVVDDQTGRPTWTGTLAWVLAELLERRSTGVFHATNGGAPVTWCGFAREILHLQGLGTPVVPVSSDRFPRPARRPTYSVLDCSATERLLGCSLPEWREALGAYLFAAVVP